MNWSDIITAAITFIAGGGLVTLFTMKQSKEAKQIENASALVKEYRDLLDEYKSEVEQHKKEIEQLKDKYTELQLELSTMNQRLIVQQTRVEAAELLKCDRLKCQQRRPPLDNEALDQFVNGKKEDDDEDK